MTGSPVIICAKNEGARLGTLGPLGDIWTHRDELIPEVISHIVVVDDRSTDNTRSVAKAFYPDLPICVVQGPGVGKGQAMATGLLACNPKADNIIFCDADLSGITPDHWRAMADARGYDQVVVRYDSLSTLVTMPGSLLWPISGLRGVGGGLAFNAAPYLNGYMAESTLNTMTYKAGGRLRFVVDPVHHTKYRSANDVATMLVQIAAYIMQNDAYVTDVCLGQYVEEN